LRVTLLPSLVPEASKHPPAQRVASGGIESPPTGGGDAGGVLAGRGDLTGSVLGGGPGGVDDTAFGLTVRVAGIDTPPDETSTTTCLTAVTASVAIEKSPLVCPAATVTLGGVVRVDGLSLEIVTTVPPRGAARSRVTVAVTLAPPSILLGETVTPDTIGPDTTVFGTGGVPSLPKLIVPDSILATTPARLLPLPPIVY
jgi:hypothetical protein